MKILLDNIIYSNVQNGGVSNAWFELSKYLLNQTDDEVNFIQESNDYLNFYRKQLNIPENQIISNGKLFNLPTRILPFEYNSDEKFIYHSSYYRGLKGAKNKIEVTTIHDFTHNYYFPYLKKIIHNSLKYPALKRANGIVCISKNTYADLYKFCPPKKNQKVEVIYNGVSNDYYNIDKLSLNDETFLKRNRIDGRFLLFIGSRANYKNFDYVISILNENIDLKLVVISGGNLTTGELKLFKNKSFDRLIFLDSASNNELNILYNTAFSLVYPSSYEGFGIPVVEAMRAGCPVIGLENPVMREISKKAAQTLNKLNINEFDIIRNNLSNKNFRKEIIETGFQESQVYSWDKCSKETHEFYQSLYNQ